MHFCIKMFSSTMIEVSGPTVPYIHVGKMKGGRKKTHWNLSQSDLGMIPLLFHPNQYHSEETSALKQGMNKYALEVIVQNRHVCQLDALF